MQSSFLQGKFRACSKHKSACLGGGPHHFTPISSSRGQAGRGRPPNTTPCVCGNLVSGNWVRRGASGWPGMVPRSLLCNLFSSCRDISETPHCVSGWILGCTQESMWLHSCESSHYGCSAPAADLEPQCSPRVSSCCFWKAPGSPSHSIQSLTWFPAPTLPAASPALLLFLKHTLCSCLRAFALAVPSARTFSP